MTVRPLTPPESRIKLVPFDQLRPGTERRYLVKDLIPRVGITIVWGPPKSGKSFWTFDVMMHVALDWSYRGRRVNAGTVVYCAFEGQSGIGARAEAFRQRHLAEEASHVPFYLQPVTLDLVSDRVELCQVIRATLGASNPVAVVLDTLNRSLRGSESSDQDMSNYIKAADAIREAFNCAVIIVHHCGINDSRPRGHTSLTGAADAQLSVKRDGDGNIFVETEFMKDGPDGDTIASRLEAVQVAIDEDGEPVTSCVVVESEASKSSGHTRVSGAAKVALEMLRKAIEEAGEPAPASNHIPPGCRTITPGLWRRYCDQGTVSESDKPDTRQKAFVRASRRLQDLDLIGIWGEHVWLSDKPDMAGQPQ